VLAIEGETMPNGVSVLLWLLFPIVVTTLSWYLLRRRARQNPNADISAGVSELDRFRDSLRQTNPPPGYTPRRRRSMRSGRSADRRR
jgi:hypothetical protein